MSIQAQMQFNIFLSGSDCPSGFKRNVFIQIVISFKRKSIDGRSLISYLSCSFICPFLKEYSLAIYIMGMLNSIWNGYFHIICWSSCNLYSVIICSIIVYKQYGYSFCIICSCFFKMIILSRHEYDIGYRT